MGIKEQVKTGTLAPADALKLVDKSSATYGWLKRRISGHVQPQAPATSKVKKYKSKKVGS